MMHVQVDAVLRVKRQTQPKNIIPCQMSLHGVEVSPNQLEGLKRCTTLLFPNDCEVSYTRTSGKAHG